MCLTSAPTTIRDERTRSTATHQMQTAKLSISRVLSSFLHTKPLNIQHGSLTVNVGSIDLRDMGFQFRRGDSEMRIVSVSKRIAAALLFFLCILEFSYSASAAPSDIAPVVTTAHRPNATSERAKRYLVLVSLDGFRFDYAQKYGAPYLIGLGKRGIAADGLMASYPSLTFPNHYSIVTGLYPEHHGIVGMSFYDPALRNTSAIGTRKRQPMEPGIAALPFGCWRRSRACAPLVFSGLALRPKSMECAPPTMSPSMISFPMKTEFIRCCNGFNCPKQIGHIS
jgi:Type I phosphodiesterase / nucleotide pyrophosphatase